ncbi:unnamed protein product, partial [marine sediment metagenome]
MTDRERFNNQMHYKPFDRSFNMEFRYWEETFHKWSIFVDNNITNDEEAEIFFNFDIIDAVGRPWIPSLNTPWINPPFEEKVIKETKTK